MDKKQREHTSLSTNYRSNCVQLGTLCTDMDCRYWHDWLETGNCVLRVKREHSLEEVGVSEGGISKERVRQLEERAFAKFAQNMSMSRFIHFLEPEVPYNTTTRRKNY